MTKPIVIRTKKQAPDAHHPDGVAADQEFEVESLAVAKRVYPGATVLRYADGTPWDGQKYAQDKPKEMEADDTTPNFSQMTRVKLEVYAADLGIGDPADRADYPNKEALIAAIEEAINNDPKGKAVPMAVPPSEPPSNAPVPPTSDEPPVVPHQQPSAPSGGGADNEGEQAKT